VARGSVITGATASAVDAPVAATSVSDCLDSAALVELMEVEGVGALLAAADALVPVFEEVASVAAASVSDCVGSAALVELVEVEGVGALLAAAESVFEVVIELV
jgi:hypothetical protein